MADFTYTPDKTFDEDIAFKTLISEFENGVEQRRPLVSAPRRSWKLDFKVRTQAEYEAVRAFYISKLGAALSFTWDNPNDGVTYTVRFAEDSITFQKLAYQLFNFSLGLIEVK